MVMTKPRCASAVVHLKGRTPPPGLKVSGRGTIQGHGVVEMLDTMPECNPSSVSMAGSKLAIVATDGISDIYYLLNEAALNIMRDHLRTSESPGTMVECSSPKGYSLSYKSGRSRCTLILTHTSSGG